MGQTTLAKMSQLASMLLRSGTLIPKLCCINCSETVQGRPTKLILRSNDKYTVKMRKLNLLALDNRRFLAEVVFLFKVSNDQYTINFDRGYLLKSMNSLDLVTKQSHL